MEEYTTKNLSISAFLYASGVTFTGASLINGEYYFKFTPKTKAEKLVKDYFTNTAQINPKELFARLNDLKDLIFSQQ